MARFGVAVPILSFTALWSPGAGGDDGTVGGGEAPAVELHCVQTTAIQQYSLDPALCSEGGAGGAGSAQGAWGGAGRHGAHCWLGQGRLPVLLGCVLQQQGAVPCPRAG